MKRRMRRNGGEWKVLAGTSGRWDRFAGRTEEDDRGVPSDIAVAASSLQEAQDIALSLVAEGGQFTSAYILAPSGIPAATIFESAGGLRAITFERYAISLFALGAPTEDRQVTVDENQAEFADAERAVTKEWVAAIKQDRLPDDVRALRMDALSGAVNDWLYWTESTGTAFPAFYAIGWLREVVAERGRVKSMSEGTLAAFYCLANRRGRWLSIGEKGIPKQVSLCVVDDAFALGVWGGATNHAFSRMQFTEGYE